MATMATPKPSSPYDQPVSSGGARVEFSLPNKVPLFYGVRKLDNLVILLVRLVGGVHADSIVSEEKKMAKLE